MNFTDLELCESVENDNFDVVIGFFDNELDVASGSSLNCGRRGGHGRQRPSGFVSDSVRGRLEQIVNASDEAASLRRFRAANFVNKLDNDELQNVIERMNLVDASLEISKCPISIALDEHHERVSLARSIFLGSQILRHHLRRVRNQVREVIVNDFNC